MKKSMIGFGAAAVLAAASLSFAPVVHAQKQPSVTPPATSDTNISDQKLDAVAAAAKRVVTLSDDYEQKLAKAPDAEKDQVRAEANKAIAKAVTDQGLSVDEYVSIMKVAQNDPSVRDKLVQRLK